MSSRRRYLTALLCTSYHTPLPICGTYLVPSLIFPKVNSTYLVALFKKVTQAAGCE